MVMAACGGTKERYLYVEDAPHNTPMPITNNYDATIYPNDQLYISVSSQFPETVKSFNEESNKLANARANTTQATKYSHNGQAVNGYRVSQSGFIVFPILGRIEVAGKTRAQLGRELEARLIQGGYVSDPVVTVDLLNFHVTVIGEVKTPSLIHSIGSRLTIFEALAQCGDITMDGLRTNVVVVRSGVNTQTVDTSTSPARKSSTLPTITFSRTTSSLSSPPPRRKRPPGAMKTGQNTSTSASNPFAWPIPPSTTFNSPTTR